MNGTKNRQSVKGEPVFVRSYDPRWIRLGAAAVQQLREALPQTVAELRHIGSTSVPHLAARPILDIAVGVAKEEDFFAVGQQLLALGYEAAEKDEAKQVFFAYRNGTARRLYMVLHEGNAWNDFLNFRNFLCYDRTAAKRYEALKFSLAARYAHNTARYIAEKADMMQYLQRKATVWSYLGKTVRMVVDRPIGYTHKKETYTLHYPINYGYIPHVLGGDGEELDVYLMGVRIPVEEYTGRIIGIVHRENDVEDKLVMAPPRSVFTQDQIARAVRFQERYYVHHIEACYEKSCGALIWRRRRGVYEFLLLRQKRSGSWSFPKGHVEPGESEIACATREVHEECGMALHPQAGFRKTLQYVLGNRVHKQVVLFLARQSGPVHIDGCEITDHRWVSAKDAKEYLPSGCISHMWRATALLREQARAQRATKAAKAQKSREE